jgi:CxxC motif-containing protein (DUF1111 family)
MPFALWRSDAQLSEPQLGDPLPDLTEEQLADFEEGFEEFTEVETVGEGLGPVFNGRGCAECHAHPVVGGASPNLGVAREVRIGRLVNGAFDPLVNAGGMLLQQRSIAEDMFDCPVNGEVVPPEATLVSLRQTTPVFGAGLMEAIADGTILRHADPHDRNRDGISGVPNRVFNPESGQVEIGRFGWKAHVPTLHLFSGDAYLNEMGITNPTFPDENLPQGQPIPEGCDLVPELEDNGEGVDGFTSFMQFLAPAPRGEITREAIVGEELFEAIGCAKCHVPTMMTRRHPIQALRNKPVNLFSDLLLHDMGTELADGIEMGTANGNEWRTAPLWGLSRRRFFMHDGLSNTIADAIRRHGGEAQNVRRRFIRLSPANRQALLAFLESL